MKALKWILVLTIGILSKNIGFGQTNDSIQKSDTTKQLYLVTKTDGGEFYGYIISDDGRELLLETKNIGKIYISKADIASIVKVADVDSKGIGNGEYADYRNDGPFTTRYYLTTNALPIKKGENYAMIHLYGPEVHFAVSDNLSLGVMSSWIASPIALAAKYSFDSKTNTHFALGTIVGSSGFLANGSAFGGLHWATVTQGDRRANVSFSAGYGYINLGNNGYDNDFGPTYQIDGSSDYHFWGGPTKSQATLTKFIGSPNSPRLIRKKRTDGAPVISISGIAPVGKKASFIFDVMAFLPTQYKRVLINSSIVKDVTYDGTYDHTTKTAEQITEDVQINQYELRKTGIQSTFLIMPGMRFNQSHNKAFQVVLAGVITTDFDGDVYTFPVPMVSWLRTF